MRNQRESGVQTALPEKLEELLNRFAERTEELTPAEWGILQLYIQGNTLEEVAQQCFISVNTAKKHNTNINRKLHVANREELLLYIDIFRRCGRLSLLSGQKH